MSYSKSIHSGKPCPDSVNHLRKRFEERDGQTHMQYIRVYAKHVALVLDRLDALEQFVEDTKAFNRRRLEELR